MNSLSHVIRKFNRFELKYLIDLKQAEIIKSELRKYLVPDEYGGCSGRYPVSSLYYDSPGRRCYWEKENGLKYRRKLRIRYYPSDEPFSDQTPVFLEVKQRVDRVTQKRRLLLPYNDALRLCNDRQVPEHAPEDRAVVDEIYVFLWQYNLLPATIVNYDRQAFVGTRYDIGLRVTFDSTLQYQAHPLRLHEEQNPLPMMGPQRVVMEIKVNERIPNWLTEMIAAHNLHLQRISKYCRSIDAASRQPAMRCTPLVAESSQEILSTTLSIFNPVEKEMKLRD